MTSERLRMGVLGAGFMGSLHARVWSQLPNTRLVAVADPDAEACKGLADDLGGGLSPRTGFPAGTERH